MDSDFKIFAAWGARIVSLRNLGSAATGANIAVDGGLRQPSEPAGRPPSETNRVEQLT
jgi:hypothetical protein